MSTPISALPPIPPNITSFTAPLIIGELFNACLFGMLSVQVYFYYLSFPRDHTYFKLLVYGVYALELAQTIMASIDTYFWFAAGFGNMLSLDNVHLSPFDTPMFGSIVALIVQGYYCFRIYVLNKKALPIAIGIALICIIQVAGGIYGGVQGYRAGAFSKVQLNIAALYIYFVGDAVADILIAITMMTLLLRTQSSNHQYTNFVIRRIINLTVESNALSAAIALLTVITYVAWPNTNYFTCPSLILGKIYSNTLLLMFNNRRYLQIEPGVANFQAHRNHMKMSTFNTSTSSTPSRNMVSDVSTFPVRNDGEEIERREIMYPGGV